MIGSTRLTQWFGNQNYGHEDEKHGVETTKQRLRFGSHLGLSLHGELNRRTISPIVNEKQFFTDSKGERTVVTRYDLEKSTQDKNRENLQEVARYWVNKPCAFVSILHSPAENESTYQLIEPHLTPTERAVLQALKQSVRTSIDYTDPSILEGSQAERSALIDTTIDKLLETFRLFPRCSSGIVDSGSRLLKPIRIQGIIDWLARRQGFRQRPHTGVRPESATEAENWARLSERQVARLRYYLRRDMIGYGRIDGIKHDVAVEDISCDGYHGPVFVYHTEFEQLLTSITFQEADLDRFVISLAQEAGRGISTRQPQVDASLADGSRAQLTLGTGVSDHGSNFTIRQFTDIPFTPVDLINWRTFSIEQLAFLWLCIENKKSILFAGGTASGKTTSLNAISLFIPGRSKIVSIEDTREVELPQRNWVASVTRPSFRADGDGEIDEFDLLEAALRQRPEYIVMGEVRGEEGRTLFQVMSTGHTTCTTFHASSVGEVLKRFTTAPINVSKTMFTALDLVAVQTQTRLHGEKVRRNVSLTEVNHYDAERDEINVRDLFRWRAETDEFRRSGESKILDDIVFGRGWDRSTLETELFHREVVLAYLTANELTSYRAVAATLQAYMSDPEQTLSLMATDELAAHLPDLSMLQSLEIDLDDSAEARVPRPEPFDGVKQNADLILRRAADECFPEYASSRNIPQPAEVMEAQFR